MTRLKSFALIPLVAATLTACTQFPELNHTQSDEIEAADYPKLVPIEPLIAQATVATTDPVQTEDALNARLAALRARAARLRGSVLSNREKQRLAQGLR